MKKLFFIFSILSFVIVNAQYKNGRVFFKDSTSSKGLIKIKTFGGIKFKSNKDSEVINYNYEKIDGFDVNGNNYRYVKNSYSTTPILLSELIEGKIILYTNQVYNPGHTIPSGFAGGGTGMTVGGGTSTIYYIKVDGKLIRLGVKIKKKHISHFKDCPILIQKIEKKEFKKWDVYDIVEFYNEDCEDL